MILTNKITCEFPVFINVVCGPLKIFGHNVVRKIIQREREYLFTKGLKHGKLT